MVMREFACYRRTVRHIRQRDILRRLRADGALSVEELARRCEVSHATIRRDLAALEGLGAIQRVHGGAVLADGAALDPDAKPGFASVASRDATDKESVARRAARLVSDGDTVLLDVGTTTMMLSRELRGRPVTVITASLAVLDVLRDDPAVDLILLGGTLRRSYHSLVGVLTEDSLRQVRATHAFLGASGVRADGSVLDTTTEEVPVKRAILAASDHCVLLVDRHKFPGTGTLRVCGSSELHTLVTNRGASPGTLAAVRKAGTEVLLA